MPSKPKHKTWNEKLHDSKGLPKVERLTGKMISKWGAGTIAIPSPLEVDCIMRKVPKGKVITINRIRELIARKHKATVGCPITTGIFAWIAANAAEESAAAGVKDITPYWRTLKSKGELNEKYPGGVKAQSSLLRQEGFSIIPGEGKKPPRVLDFEKHMAGL